MKAPLNQLSSLVEYPDADGQPMAESDRAREYLVYTTKVLEIYFQNYPDVYVSGNLFVYYKEGNPQAVVAPDVFVVRGVAKIDRRSYKTWEEGDKAPDFVLEITSKSTKKEDQETKPEIYSDLGVQEYLQYDPTGDYLNPRLQGLRLVEGNYQPIPQSILPNDVLSLSSEVLGLELRLHAGELRFYDAIRGEILLTHEESEQAWRQAEARITELEARLRALQGDASE